MKPVGPFQLTEPPVTKMPLHNLRYDKERKSHCRNGVSQKCIAKGQQIIVMTVIAGVQYPSIFTTIPVTT